MNIIGKSFKIKNVKPKRWQWWTLFSIIHFVTNCNSIFRNFPSFKQSLHFKAKNRESSSYGINLLNTREWIHHWLHIKFNFHNILNCFSFDHRCQWSPFAPSLVLQPILANFILVDNNVQKSQRIVTYVTSPYWKEWFHVDSMLRRYNLSLFRKKYIDFFACHFYRIVHNKFDPQCKLIEVYQDNVWNSGN